MTFQVVEEHLRKPVIRQSWAGLLTQRDPAGVWGPMCYTECLFLEAQMGFWVSLLTRQLRRTHMTITMTRDTQILVPLCPQVDVLSL